METMCDIRKSSTSILSQTGKNSLMYCAPRLVISEIYCERKEIKESAKLKQNNGLDQIKSEPSSGTRYL